MADEQNVALSFLLLAASAPKPSPAKKASMSSAPCRKLRVLCLHGFGQDKAKMRDKMGALRRVAKSSAEFVFCDAPHEVGGGAPGRCWWNFTGDRHVGPTRYRGWWGSSRSAPPAIRAARPT